MQILNVSKREAGQRLDKYLLRFLNQAPQSFIYKMLRKKNIVLNDKKADGSEKICETDEIKLYLADETISKFSKPIEVATKVSLDIIYEDEDVIFMNKPAGVLSQKATSSDVSMNDYLISYLVESGNITPRELNTFHPAICNRLDRNTSGLLLAGKSMAGLQGLSWLLKERTMQKFYLCLVGGKVRESSLIKGYLKKDSKSNTVKVSHHKNDDDSYIETYYEPLASNDDVTLLKVELITGRTHQIRSHLASINHPIIGDYKYGNKKMNQQYRAKYDLKHQLLHAWYVHFDNVEGTLNNLSRQQFIVNVPRQFQYIIKTEHLEECNEEVDLTRII